ncbi:MAG: RNA polymerase sigma-70 factor [Bacteroidales bacterium]|nr:RNA polymerase sigma-70 factor [Bacteroidales bacterium]
MDLKTFNTFVNDYSKRFVRFACSYVHDEKVSEDLVMESMMVYWTKKDSLSADTNPPAYVLSVLKNRCLDHLRHVAVTQNASETISEMKLWEIETSIKTLEAFEPSEVFTDEINNLVSKTLLELPETTRRIFMMSRYENMKYKDIAAECDMTVKGVEFHISMALSSLRKALADYLTVSVILFFFQ